MSKRYSAEIDLSNNAKKSFPINVEDAEQEMAIPVTPDRLNVTLYKDSFEKAFWPVMIQQILK